MEYAYVFLFIYVYCLMVAIECIMSIGSLKLHSAEMLLMFYGHFIETSRLCVNLFYVS